MEKIYYRGNKICLLISAIILFTGCINVNEKIIRKVTKYYTYTLSPDRWKGEINPMPRDFLIVTQDSLKFKDYDIFIIQPNIFTYNDQPTKLWENNKPFTYTKYYKQNGVYVFIKLLNSKEKVISNNIFYELYREFGWTEYDPFIYLLVINPKNKKYVIIPDNQQYLPTDSLLKQPESIKLLESIK